MTHAHDVPKEHWFALNQVFRMRAIAMVAGKVGVPVNQVTRLTVWGNNSETAFVDLTNARIGNQPALQVIDDPSLVPQGPRTGHLPARPRDHQAHGGITRRLGCAGNSDHDPGHHHADALSNDGSARRSSPTAAMAFLEDLSSGFRSSPPMENPGRSPRDITSTCTLTNALPRTSPNSNSRHRRSLTCWAGTKPGNWICSPPRFAWISGGAVTRRIFHHVSSPSSFLSSRLLASRQ